VRAVQAIMGILYATDESVDVLQIAQSTVERMEVGPGAAMTDTPMAEEAAAAAEVCTRTSIGPASSSGPHDSCSGAFRHCNDAPSESLCCGGDTPRGGDTPAASTLRTRRPARCSKTHGTAVSGLPRAVARRLHSLTSH
jgi:hypothetical protein